MHRDSSFCAKSVRYNIFTNGAPYDSACANVVRSLAELILSVVCASYSHVLLIAIAVGLLRLVTKNRN